MPRYRIYVLKQRTYSSMRARYGDQFRCSQCQRDFQPYMLILNTEMEEAYRVKSLELSGAPAYRE